MAENDNSTIFTGVRIVDAENDRVTDPVDILIEHGRIARIAEQGLKILGARIVDCDGKYALPGLIDCHVHPFLADTNVAQLDRVPPTLMTARAANILRGMVMRGFTTVRDAAGGDWGIKQAVEDGEILGPRMFVAGRALSQTGGHGDMRIRTDDAVACACSHALAYTSQNADGVDEVRKAVRNELRKGADQIKIMVSGGISSPHDPLESDQYSPDEIRTAVEEAERHGTYVMAHAYSGSAIQTALDCGVRTIEHGNMIDEKAARTAADRGSFVVPTLVTYEVLADTAKESGWSTDMLSKLETVRSAGLNSVRICRNAGVQLGFGTDLLGDSFGHQSKEFLIRSEVETPAQIIDSATRVNAMILRMENDLGAIREGAIADILIVEDNPLENLDLLQDDGAHLPAIMKDGALVKCDL